MGIKMLGKIRNLRSFPTLIFIIVLIFVYALYSTRSISSTETVRIPDITDTNVMGDESEVKLERIPTRGKLSNTGEFRLAFVMDKNQISPKPLEINNSITDTMEPPNIEINLFEDEQSHNTTQLCAKPDLEKTSQLISKVDSKKITTPAVLKNPRIELGKLYVSGYLDEEINPERICPLKGLTNKLLILITSALEHVDSRMSVRQTWGHYGTRRDIGIAFVMGRSLNKTLNSALSEENYLYSDMIRGFYMDTYENLTLKIVSALEWADEECPRAKYILKTDDDVFINVPLLLKFIKKLEQQKARWAIYGFLADSWLPVRNKKSKYYVSRAQYPNREYPSFTSGPAYLMTGDIVHKLYERSLQTVYLRLEDVFITGIVAESLGIKRYNAPEFVNRRIDFNLRNIRKAISVHKVRYAEKYDLWLRLHNQSTKF